MNGRYLSKRITQIKVYKLFIKIYKIIFTSKYLQKQITIYILTYKPTFLLS